MPDDWVPPAPIEDLQDHRPTVSWWAFTPDVSLGWIDCHCYLCGHDMVVTGVDFDVPMHQQMHVLEDCVLHQLECPFPRELAAEFHLLG